MEIWHPPGPGPAAGILLAMFGIALLIITIQCMRRPRPPGWTRARRRRTEAEGHENP